MRRILVITTSYPSDDDDCAGHFVQAEVKRAINDGHEVTVLAPRAQRTDATERVRVRVIGLPHLGAFGSPGALARLRGRPFRWVGALIFVVTARSTARKLGNFDGKIAHFMLPSFWPICSRMQGPLEVVVHGSDLRLFERLPKALRSWMLRSVQKRPLTFRCVSDELAERLKAQLPTGSRIDIRVAPSPIDIPQLASKLELRERLGVGSEQLLVIVSRLVKSKRVDVALRSAFAMPNAKVVVCGDGPERQSLEREFPQAHFIGRVPRKRALEWIAASDLLLSASREEGAPTVIREARALGVPVMTANAGDLEKWAASDPGISVVL